MSFPSSRRPKSLFDVTAGPAPSQADTLVYEQHFGLTEKAFSLNADQRFVYDSSSYLAARESLLAGLRRREGLHVLTGQIGTGKTTLCRAVLAGLGRNTYSSLVPDPFASREDLLKTLLIDFGVWSIQELTTGTLHQASRTELGYLLSEFVDSLPRDSFVVVIIDEAQNLSLPLIEETRLLSDTFGASGRLQIVFVGQPELLAKLKAPEMRQVDQRVCGYHHLEPMNRDAVSGYLEHRLKAAGARNGLVLFPPDVVEVLHARTGGVPRLINRICDRALLRAYQQGHGDVTRADLDAALVDVGAVTLSPTWDSIMFADTPASASKAAPQPPDKPAAPPMAATPTVASLAAASSVELFDADQAVFKSELEHWVAKDLVDRPESASSAPSTPGRTAPRNVPLQERRSRVPSSAPKRVAQPETYGEKLMRRWLKRAVIAVGLFAIANVIMIAVALVPGMTSLDAMPQAPAAPAPALPAALLPAALPSDVATAASRAPIDPAESADWLVAVGLFSDRDRADRLVDVLTQAGLPAMERPLTVSGQQMQQIVLGPFFSRTDALADMLRLQQLGGYDDARVIDGSREP